MPTYTYECPECQALVELARMVVDRDYHVECTCGQDMTRIITPTNFVLKGGGWFKEGYTK